MAENYRDSLNQDNELPEIKALILLKVTAKSLDSTESLAEIADVRKNFAPTISKNIVELGASVNSTVVEEVEINSFAFGIVAAFSNKKFTNYNQIFKALRKTDNSINLYLLCHDYVNLEIFKMHNGYSLLDSDEDFKRLLSNVQIFDSEPFALHEDLYLTFFRDLNYLRNTERLRVINQNMMMFWQ